MKRKHATDGTSNRSREHRLNDRSRAAVDRDQSTIAFGDRAETTGPRNDGSLTRLGPVIPCSSFCVFRSCISATFHSSTDWLHVRDGRSSAGNGSSCRRAREAGYLTSNCWCSSVWPSVNPQILWCCCLFQWHQRTSSTNVYRRFTTKCLMILIRRKQLRIQGKNFINALTANVWLE